MKIGFDPNKAVGLYDAAGKEIKKKNAARSSGESFDRISISPEAQKFRQAAEFSGAVRAALNQETDAGLIADIKQRVAAGEYHVPSGKVADAILKYAESTEA